MSPWIHMPLTFAVGFAFGAVSAFFHFRARLKFYRQFIEQRLSTFNLVHSPAHTGNAR